MKCIAVDDEPLALNIIEMFCKKISSLELVSTFTDASDALDFLKNNPVDLIFLDINMPQMTGVEFAKVIDDKIMVIFTTAYQNYAVEGFELEALDYLLKPFSYQRFYKAVTRAENQYKLIHKPTITPANENDPMTCEFVMIRSDSATIRVEISTIICVEGLKDYVKIYTTDKNYVTKITMKNIESHLVAHGFMRVHKSYVVNLNMVKSFENNHVILPKNLKVSVGNLFRNNFVEYLDKNKIQ